MILSDYWDEGGHTTMDKLRELFEGTAPAGTASSDLYSQLKSADFNATGQLKGDLQDFIGYILGLKQGEFDRSEIAIPSADILLGMQRGNYLDDLTKVTCQYEGTMADSALNMSSMLGGIGRSKDKFRKSQLQGLSPYTGAMQSAEKGIEGSIFQAKSDLSDFMTDWMSLDEG